MSFNALSQMDNFGINFQINFNDLAFSSLQVKGYKAALQREFVTINKSAIIGIYARKDKFVFGLNFDLYKYSSEIMYNPTLKISEIHNNKEQFIVKDVKDAEQNNEDNFKDFGVNVLLGVPLYEKNTFRILFSNRIGFKIITDRFSSVILKETGANKYYTADYSFNISPMYFYNPSIEFEYLTVEKKSSLYCFTGVNFQQFVSTIKRSIKDPYSSYPAEITNDTYENLSATWMLGLGLRLNISRN